MINNSLAIISLESINFVKNNRPIDKQKGSEAVAPLHKEGGAGLSAACVNRPEEC
jgi:hypothetical protein